MLGWFYNHEVTLQLVAFPQDPSGGSLPTPSTVDVPVPACVQQDYPAEINGQGQYSRGTKTRIRVYFGASYAPSPDQATAAVTLLATDSRIVLDDGRILVLVGPPYDESGRGEYLVAECKYIT